MKFLEKTKNNYEMYLYIILFSIFIRDVKLYIPLFALNTLYVLYLIYKNEIKLDIKKWNISLGLFIIWSVLNTIIVYIFLGKDLDYVSFFKLLINMSFLISAYFVIDNIGDNLNKEKLIKFLELVILLNFIQVIYIYIDGKLFNDFLSGSLTESSDAAYTISSYHNIIGAENKNIWATKFTLTYLMYLYISTFATFKINNIKKLLFILMGIITIVLLLSRTAQIAIILPIIFLVFYSIKDLGHKYKVVIYSVCGIVFLGALAVFFEKFFHLKFDMSDGGFTRLYIWKEFLFNVFDTNFIIGNGIGYSAYFIQDILGRNESNLHNIFLNIFFEMGIIGVGCYITFIIQFFKEYLIKKNILKNLFMIIIPMLIIVCLQYLGYDNDLVVTLSLLIIINKIIQKDEQRI